MWMTTDAAASLAPADEEPGWDIEEFIDELDELAAAPLADGEPQPPRTPSAAAAVRAISTVRGRDFVMAVSLLVSAGLHMSSRAPPLGVTSQGCISKPS